MKVSEETLKPIRATCHVTKISYIKSNVRAFSRHFNFVPQKIQGFSNFFFRNQPLFTYWQKAHSLTLHALVQGHSLMQ